MLTTGTLCKGCAKTAESIEMPFRMLSEMGGLREACIGDVLDEGPDPPCSGLILRGKGMTIVKYRDLLSGAVQKRLNRLRCHMEHGLGWNQENVC